MHKIVTKPKMEDSQEKNLPLPEELLPFGYKRSDYLPSISASTLRNSSGIQESNSLMDLSPILASSTASALSGCSVIGRSDLSMDSSILAPAIKVEETSSLSLLL